MNDDILTATEEYTEKGLVVHPLSSPKDTKYPDVAGKRSLLPAWQMLTETPKNIGKYINKGCNIGLVCGKASGITGIDLDSFLFINDIFNGFELDTLKSHRTDGRGHIYFKYNSNLPSQKHHDLGIEILNDGSNMVLPPSVHKSGSVYRWDNPDAPIMEMPQEIEKRLLKLFQTETELKQLLSKCRRCFRDVIKRRPDMHGAAGREYMLSVCTDLKAQGATEVHIEIFAKLMYQHEYNRKITLQEWQYIDTAKTWTCNKLKEKLPSYVDLSQCEICKTSDAYNKKNIVNKAISTFKTPELFEIAQAMQSKTPIYYDKSKNYWIWNGKCYEMVDETDILIALREVVDDEHRILGNKKNAILDAIRITGRERIVKEVPKTWIHLKSVVIDMATGEQIIPTPEYLLTAPLPHETGDSIDTPIIDKLFSDWVGDRKQTLYHRFSQTV